MHLSSERQVQSKLASYLAGEQSLNDFKDWLVGATWNVDQSGDAELIGLTYDIRLALAEFDDDCDESRLRDQLRPLLARGLRHVAS